MVRAYPASAEADLAVVEDGGLARRDRALRRVEAHEHPVRTLGRDRGLGVGVAVADLDAGPDLAAGRLDGEPVPVASVERRRAEVLLPAHDDGARGGEDGEHVERLRRVEAQPPPLADSEPVDSRVAAERLAVGTDDRTGPILADRLPLDEARVVAVGHEADLLALRLVCGGEAERSGVRAHGGLVEVAHGEDRAAELLLRE